MKRGKTWFALILSLLCMLAANLVMTVSPIGQPLLLQYGDGTGMLDLLLHYTGVQASAALASLGVEGTFVYTRLLLIDFIFIISSALFFSNAMRLLLHRLKLDGIWRKLIALAYWRSAFDAAENILILLSMHVLYNGHAVLTLASFASILKWLSMLLYLIALVAALLYGLLHRGKMKETNA